MQIVELAGAALALSVPVEADIPEITLACQDAEITRWTPLPDPYGAGHAEGFVRTTVPTGWADGTTATWAIREQGAEHRLAGMIGLHEITAGSAEIGYWVAPWARGRGVVVRATGLVLDHAFAADGLALDRVFWLALVGNWPSRRVAWRAGFRVEGTVRGHALARGRRYDAWLGTLLREDPRWPAEPWPDDAPADGRAVPPTPRG